MIKDQSESGLSIREWCRGNNISHGKSTATKESLEKKH